jgi:hypothetical protein
MGFDFHDHKFNLINSILTNCELIFCIVIIFQILLKQRFNKYDKNKLYKHQDF